jgi:hypothetical protein
MATVTSSIPSSAYAAYLPHYSGPQTSDAGLVQAATTLSEEANILSSMGGTSSIPQTSDATSLLSWFVQPYSSTSLPLPSLGQGNVSSVAQAGLDQQILGGQSNSTSAGIYSASGLLQNSSNNWTTLMQNNPSLAAAMNTDATNLGIISQLSTYA